MSTPTSGDFSCADLLVIQSKAELIFNDENRNADLTPFSEAAQAILENQTATLEPITDRDKDRKLTVNWIQVCDAEIIDCTGQCDVTGEEAGAFCKDYEITNCKETGFSLRRDYFRTSTLSREEIVAKQMAGKLKGMDEYIAQYVVGKLDLFSGVNAFNSMYTVSGTTTEIPAVAWNANLNGYLAMTMLKNKMRGMYSLSGDNLYLANWNAGMEAANGEGKGAANKFRTFKMYFDMFNVDSVMGDKTTFLINPSAVALVSKNRFTAAPQMVVGKNINQKRYTVASPSLPGIFYDVYYEAKCDPDQGESGDIIDAWKIVARFDLFQNPLGCTQTRTGVLKFQCV